MQLQFGSQPWMSSSSWNSTLCIAFRLNKKQPIFVIEDAKMAIVSESWDERGEQRMVRPVRSTGEDL